MKYVIIEDSLAARENLKRKINVLDLALDLVGEAETIRSAYDLIQNQKPDILLLDIMLEHPAGTSFEVLKMLYENDYKDFQIIFITGYDSFYRDAIKYSACDYILKPIDKEELYNALKRAINYRDRDKEYQRLKYLAEYRKDQKPSEVLIESSNGKINKIEVNQILFLEAITGEEITKFNLVEEKMFHAFKSIGEYEKILCKLGAFFRISRQHIVNLKEVLNYNKQKRFVVLSNGLELPISRRRQSDFFKIWSDF